MNEEQTIEQLNPREKYVNKLQDDLFAAAMSQRFVESEEGKYLLDYITGVVTTLTNQLINSRLPHEEYIEIRAKADILRRLKAVLEAKASPATIERLKTELQIAQSED